jgi:hypothetical protein
VSEAPRPPRWVLVGLVVLAATPPFVARAFGTGLGAFSMFTRLERYHLELSVETPSGSERVAVPSLAPHMSRDAAQVILPASSYGFGQEQIDELEAGLGDLGTLLCALRPDARAARLRLFRGRFREPDRKASEVTVPCASRGGP